MRYFWHLVLSAGYFFMLAAILSVFTDTPLLWNLVLIFTAAMTVFLAGLALAVRWAARGEQERPQFSLGTILFITSLAAIYFGVARSIGMGTRVETWVGWMGVFLYSGILLVLACPATLLMGDLLLGLAAWLVHRPAVQRWLRRWSRARRG